jgi:uncharacterized protein (DUF2062 family)
MADLKGLARRRIVEPLLRLLRSGVAPRELALAIALGATIAIVPVLGVSTPLCAAVALALRLNLPAIQLVNYLLTPVQLLLIIPFLRLGEAITGAPRFPITLDSGLALLSNGVLDAVRVLAVAIVHASLAWLLVAPLLAFVLFRICLPALRRLLRAQPRTTPLTPGVP